MTSKSASQYTLHLAGGSSEAFSRKEYAIKAGEASSEGFVVRSSSGKVVYESGNPANEVAKPAPKGKTKTVKYEQGSAAFFSTLGDAGIALAESMGLEGRKVGRAVEISGGPTADAAKAISKMWTAAYAAFKEWKKGDKERRREWYKTLDGKREMLAAEHQFFADFSRDYIKSL